MKEEILKPLTEYIDELSKDTSRTVWILFGQQIIKRNNFGKLPLLLEMFIPCLNGKPLDKLDEGDFIHNEGDNVVFEDEYWISALKEFKKAEAKVLFKGWEVSNEAESGMLLGNKEMSYSIGYDYERGFFLLGNVSVKTIESISHLNLPLTNQGKEQIL